MIKRILLASMLAATAALAAGSPSIPPTQYQNGGTPLGVGFVVNCSTGMSCLASGTTITLTSTGGGGGVSSVAQTAPVDFSVSGSPITTSGTLGITWAATPGITLTALTGGASATGGTIVETTGPGGATTGASGAMTLTTGAVTAGWRLGAATLSTVAGATSTTTAGVSGNITIQTGAGGASSSTGSGNAGNAGSISILGGVGGANTGAGGTGAFRQWRLSNLHRRQWWC